MSKEDKPIFPDPSSLATQYYEQAEKYVEQGAEAYRFHSQAGRQLFIRYRFYLLGLLVAGIAFAILNRELSAPLIKMCPEITSVRVAIGIWAVGVAVGLFSIQATITSHFVDAQGDSALFSHKAHFSGLAARQNQRLAGGLAEDPQIEAEIKQISEQRDNEAAEIQDKRERLINREFLLSTICASCFFFGSAVFAVPLFN